MTSRSMTVTATTIPAVLIPSPVLANPISLTGGASLIAVPILLPLEGWLIALWARDSSVYVGRFVAVWTLITTLTLGLLVLVVAGLGNTVSAPVAVIAGESAVILVEAVCISGLLGHETFARNPTLKPGFGTCLAYSAGVNVISFVGGVLAVGLA